MQQKRTDLYGPTITNDLASNSTEQLFSVAGLKAYINSLLGNTHVSIVTLNEYTATADGQQVIDLPVDALGVLDMKILEISGGVRSLYQLDYTVSGLTLTISADAAIQTGDKICGSYYLITGLPESITILNVIGA